MFAWGGWLAVRLSVSGSTDVVPDVIGLLPEEAVRRLEEAGMVAEIEAEPLRDEALPAGSVARQDPGPGTSVKRVRSIRLMLASGPSTHELPSMVGDSRSRAVILLGQQDVDIAYVASVHSYEHPRDAVVAQEPNPAELPPGTRSPIRLLTSLGPRVRSYVMPDLRHRSGDEVRARLEQLGFEVVTRAHRAEAIANVGPGIVVEQIPAPGRRVAEGTRVTLGLSR